MLGTARCTSCSAAPIAHILLSSSRQNVIHYHPTSIRRSYSSYFNKALETLTEIQESYPNPPTQHSSKPRQHPPKPLSDATAFASNNTAETSPSSQQDDVHAHDEHEEYKRQRQKHNPKKYCQNPKWDVDDLVNNLSTTLKNGSTPKFVMKHWIRCSRNHDAVSKLTPTEHILPLLQSLLNNQQSVRLPVLWRTLQILDRAGKIDPKILAHLIKEMHHEDALRLYHELAKWKVSLHPAVCNTILRRCLLVGRLRFTEQLLKEMKERGFTPNAGTYSIMAHGCLEKGELRQALHYLNEGAQNTTPPTIEDWNRLLLVHARKGDEGNCQSLFQRIMQVHGAADQYTYSVMITCLLVKRDWKGAINVLGMMRRNLGSEKEVDQSVHMNQILCFLCQNNLVDEAVKFKGQYTTHGVKLNSRAGHALIDMFANRRQPDDAQKIMDEMVGAGIQLDGACWWALFRAYKGAGMVNKAEEVVEEALRRRVGMKVGELIGMAGALLEVGRWRVAGRVLERVKGMAGVKRHVVEGLEMRIRKLEEVARRNGVGGVGGPSGEVVV
ncbi:hypothetical protein HDV00_004754 [Rhizophlyctis rosea]|nr:hypothetical protein HDV00_004754 [Rhizophlyctis rosea]